jgi:septal ring-binding cell division protein DamX
MKLHWLQLNRSGVVLEISHLKDYGGQPLVFRPPSLTRRCVTDEVFNNPLVADYRTQRLLIEVDSSGAVSPPPAAPTPPKAVEPPAELSVVQTTTVPPTVTEPASTEPVSEPAVEEPKANAAEPTSSEPTPDSSVSNDEAAPKSGFELKRRNKR